MANTIKLGNGNWATKEGSLLAYNDENNNFKPLPFTTTRASSASVVNKQGLIETVGSGIPRIDFSDDANGALLLEPTVTNLIVHSEDFDQRIKTNITINSNVVASPRGGIDASRINFNTASSSFFRFVSSSGDPDGKTYIYSIYLKADSSTSVTIGILGSGAGLGYITKTVNLTNEWQRFDVSSSFVGTGDNVRVRVLGTEIGSVFAWGSQLEENSYASSYIKTIGTAQTRVADTASDAGNSTVINSTEGTLYGEFSNTENDISDNRINLSDGTAINWVFIGKEGANVRAYLRANNLTLLSNQTTPLASINRVALSYKSGNIKVYINGVQIISLTDAFSFTAPLNQMNFGYYNGGATTTKASWKSVQVYTTALSDAELTSLTTI